MRQQLSILVSLVVISVLVSLFFRLPAIEGVEVWTNLTLGFCALAALHYQSKAHQHQKEMQKWEMNKEALTLLATALSDAIESTKQNIQSFEEDISTTYERDIFERLHKAIRHTIDIYAALFDEALNTAINKYKIADDEIREQWNHHAIEVIDALEESKRLMSDLLEKVKASIKAHASL